MAVKSEKKTAVRHIIHSYNKPTSDFCIREIRKRVIQKFEDPKTTQQELGISERSYHRYKNEAFKGTYFEIDQLLDSNDLTSHFVEYRERMIRGVIEIDELKAADINPRDKDSKITAIEARMKL